MSSLEFRKLAAAGARVPAPDVSVMALLEEYERLSVEPDRPFPNLETFQMEVREDQLTTVDVNNDFTLLLDEDAIPRKGIVMIEFPDGVRPLLVPREIVGTILIEVATAKISRYLQDAENAYYAASKLSLAFRGNDLILRQALEDATILPRKAASQILAPSDFQFHFWTHLTDLLLQDVRAKVAKTERDHGLCQSALIVAYSVFHMKGGFQRDQEKAADLKKLDAAVRRPPCVFGYQDLCGLKDEKGVSFVNRRSPDFIYGFLKEKTKPSDGETLPFLVRVHVSVQNKDYFIQRDNLVAVFLRKRRETSDELRTHYLDEWVAALKDFTYPPAAQRDSVFRLDVEIRIKEEYPLFSALSNGSVLCLAAELPGTAETARAELAKCFSAESILRPFDELLALSRSKLLKDVRLYLPFWLTMPIVSDIVRLFRFGPHGVEDKKGGKKGVPGP
ncbi:MAG TPA: hypothetical protein VMU36_12215 [Spirochaetia bacterium]|nr:hypothetical protein [Spirochaetia bacterium]